MEEIIKSVKDSYTVMTEMVLGSHVNGIGRLFGGQIMSWMDIAGGICAKRHSNCEVVTACVEKLEFFRPGDLNDVVVVKARMKSVGNSSMNVEVTAHIEKGGNRTSRDITCSANFIFVAIDKKGKTLRVPRLQVEV